MKPKPRQIEMKLKTWGGRRAGSGRKPKNAKPGVPHRRRPALASRFPVHATLRVREGLPNLREEASFEAILGAFEKGHDRFGFRLVHYSVQGNHCHLIVEAKDAEVLARGMKGLLVRMARALNRAHGRRGQVFADRYHTHVLRTPREVANAVAYVLGNHARHAARAGRFVDDGLDPASSVVLPALAGLGRVLNVVAPAHTWLLTVGWRRARRRPVARAQR